MSEPLSTILLAAAIAVVAALVVGAGLYFLVARRLKTEDPEELKTNLALAVAENTRLSGIEAELERLRGEKSELDRTAADTSAALRAARDELERERKRLAEASEKADVQARVSEARISDLIDERTLLERERAQLRQDLKHERENAAEKLRLLTEAKDQMRKEFSTLSNELMAKHGAQFKAENKEQLDSLLGPLKERIIEFQKKVGDSHAASLAQHQVLKAQIESLQQSSQAMTSEAQNLTRALKGKVQTQGAWGEMILESILKRSGLREGEEYHLQSHHTGDDGQRLRPDVIVDLPNDERIVIDSKVSLKDFEAYVNAEAEEDRDVALAAHALSMRRHVKGLAEKDYAAAVPGKLDYVLMFVPIEAALSVALSHDRDLLTYAMERRVALVTPSTLILVLKTVNSIWKVDRQNRNAEEIASRAGKLYDKFVGFADDMQTLGKRLSDAEGSYRDAVKKLASGPGNLVRQVEMLRELGAETGKRVPDDLLAEAGPLGESVPKPSSRATLRSPDPEDLDEESGKAQGRDTAAAKRTSKSGGARTQSRTRPSSPARPAE